MSTPLSCSSSRWSPTSQQLMILKQLYRRGVRSPNALQRQIIAAHLSFYGHIHPKNVFYWFQNHKAWDRRRRLQLTKKQQQQQEQQKMIYGIFYAQGNGRGDEEAERMKEEEWKIHDLMMKLDTCPFCNNRPLVTLQLFPLTSSK